MLGLGGEEDVNHKDTPGIPQILGEKHSCLHHLCDISAASLVKTWKIHTGPAVAYRYLLFLYHSIWPQLGKKWGEKNPNNLD